MSCTMREIINYCFIFDELSKRCGTLFIYTPFEATAIHFFRETKGLIIVSADMCVCFCGCLSGGSVWVGSTLHWPLDPGATDPSGPLFLLICPQLCVTLKHRAQVSEQTSVSLQSHRKVCYATAAVTSCLLHAGSLFQASNVNAFCCVRWKEILNQVTLLNKWCLAFS